MAQSYISYLDSVGEPRLAAAREELDQSLAALATGGSAEAVENAVALLNSRATPAIVLTPAEILQEPTSLDSAELLQEPAAPSGPSSHLARNTILAAILGVFVAVMVIFFLEYLQRPVRTPAQMERGFGLTNLGSVPRWRKGGGASGSPLGRLNSEPGLSESVGQVAASLAFTATASQDGLIPWQKLEERIRPVYPKPGKGRRPYPLPVMLRIHCVQLFYNLSDPGMEDLLYEAESVRRFVGLNLTEALPDETTILNFRHLLECHELGKGLLDETNAHLESQGLRLREGTIVDASIIEAPSSKTVAVTSPGRGDRHSSLVASLGVALSSHWRQVILVDSDFRHPSLHNDFDLDNSLGLSDLLSNPDLKLADVVQSTNYSGLQVVTSGTIPADPTSLISSPKMSGVLESLKELAELVLIDTPPSLDSADGMLLASQVDGIVIAVNATKTRRDSMSATLENLRRANQRFLGFIWN